MRAVDEIVQRRSRAHASAVVVRKQHAARNVRRVGQPEDAAVANGEAIGAKETARRIEIVPLLARWTERGPAWYRVADVARLRVGRLLNRQEIRTVRADGGDDAVAPAAPPERTVRSVVVADVEGHHGQHGSGGFCPAYPRFGR